MYVDPNFKSKKALKEAVKNGETVTVFSPGPFGVNTAKATQSVEGPHYPKPHTWYATVTIDADGKVLTVK